MCSQSFPWSASQILEPRMFTLGGFKKSVSMGSSRHWGKTCWNPYPSPHYMTTLPFIIMYRGVNNYCPVNLDHFKGIGNPPSFSSMIFWAGNLHLGRIFIRMFMDLCHPDRPWHTSKSWQSSGCVNDVTCPKWCFSRSTMKLRSSRSLVPRVFSIRMHAVQGYKGVRNKPITLRWYLLIMDDNGWERTIMVSLFATNTYYLYLICYTWYPWYNTRVPH